MSIYYIAICDVPGCDWCSLPQDRESDADVALIEHECEKHPGRAVPASNRDWQQLQIDIGDDIYERQRYEEDRAVDIVPDEQYPWTKPDLR